MNKELKGMEAVALGLTEDFIKSLNFHNIRTVLQFLNESNRKLCFIMSLSEEDIENVKSAIINQCFSTFLAKKYGALQKNKNTIKLLPTGIKMLDEILDGGIVYDTLIEICGNSSSGKTLLCLTMAGNFIKNFNYSVLYIDTKNDFSALRFKEILNLNYKLSQNEIRKIMERMLIIKITKANDLIELLNQLLSEYKNSISCKFIIIDSLPSLWNSYKGNNRKKGKILLANATFLMKKLISEQKKIFIVINTITIQEDKNEVEDNSENLGKIQPSLGKYWEEVPTLRLFIEQKPNDLYKSFYNVNHPYNCKIMDFHKMKIRNQCEIKILKSLYIKDYRKCIITLDTKGVF